MLLIFEYIDNMSKSDAHLHFNAEFTSICDKAWRDGIDPVLGIPAF